MTIGGLSGMVVTTPLGALVDRTRAKRAIVVTAAIVITLAAIAGANSRRHRRRRAWCRGAGPGGAAFLALGAIAAVALALWLAARPIMAARCAVTPQPS